MAFAWGDAAAAGADERRLQRKEATDLQAQLADMAYRQALIRQAETQDQRLREQADFERQKFDWTKQQAQTQADDAATAKRQAGNQRAAAEMIFQGMLTGQTDVPTGRLLMGREGVLSPEDALPGATTDRNPLRVETMENGQRVIKFVDPSEAVGQSFPSQPPQPSAGPQAPVRVETMENGKRVVKFLHPSQVVGQTFEDQPPAAVDRPPTQGQFTVAGYAARLAQAEPTITATEKAIVGMNPAMFWAQSKLPPAGQSKEMQNYMQAARNLINAQLRRESGAVISDSEFAEARAQYLPAPGDDATTLQLKRANRQQIYNSNRRAAGNAYEGLEWPESAAPKVGDVKTFPNGKKGRWDGKGWAEIK